MLVIDLVKQQWKKDFRTQGFYKNLAVGILLGLVALYMAAILLFLGFTLDKILEEAHSTLNPMQLFNGAMLYLMLAGLTLRFFMQQLNTINLPPYQVLPIKRSALVNFLLLKPLTSPINYVLLLVVVPFAVRSVAGYYGALVALRFVLSFVLMVWFDSLLTAFLKRQFGPKVFSALIIIAVFGGIAALEYYNIFSLFRISEIVFGFIVLHPAGLIVSLAAVAGAFLLNKWFFSRNYYAESFNKRISGRRTTTAGLTFFERFGVIGEIISLETKLILRHKRTKSILYMSSIFLLYGLLFYTNKEYTNGSHDGMLFFAAMLITGMLTLMFGQWVISWDSNHFDCLMTRNIPVGTYLNANYYLMIGFNILCFVLTTPYFYFGTKIVWMQIAAFLYNTGVNIFLLMFFAPYNTKRVDLSNASAMNYQGTTYKSFLIVLPIMFVPMILVGGLSMLVPTNVALIILSVLGVLGILFRKPLLQLCVAQFNRRKYAMAEGFRQRE